MFIKQNLFDSGLILLVAVIYLTNNLVLKQVLTGALGEFAKGYLNDLFAPIFLLAYSNVLLSRINHRIHKLWQMLILIGVAGIVWEYLAPLVKPSSISDPYDLVCYFVGAVLYWILLKIKHLKKD